MTVTSTQPLISRSADWRDIHQALVQAQKSNRNAPAYSRWVNRPFGRVLAATAYKVGLTPNVISTVSACFSYGALVLLALSSPSIALGLSVGLLLVVGYALDSADGQVARLSGGGSLAGEWLDHMFDAAKTTGFHLAVLVFWVRNLGDWPLWTALVPLAFVLQASVWFFGIILTDLLMRNAGQKKQVLAVEEGRQGSLMSFLGIPADYGVLCLLMLLIGWFEGWRVLYAGLAAVNVGILSLQLVRWYRRVRSV